VIEFSWGHNFKAPDLSQISFSGGLNVKGTYKNFRKIKREFYDMSVALNFEKPKEAAGIS
jgi:hypothetical protein